jgi:hypothetical protein
MRLLSSLIVLTLLCAAGCGTTATATYLTDEPMSAPPRAARSVRIFASGPPARPHEDIALIHVDQTRGLNEQGTEVMLDRLKQQAGEMGCDGVVLQGFRDRTGWRGSDSFLALLDPDATTLDATCIVFTEPPRGRPAAVDRGRDYGVAATNQKLDFEQPR